MAGEIPPMIVEILVETDKMKQQLAQVQTKLGELGSSAEKAKGPIHGLKGQFAELGSKLMKGVGLIELVHFLGEATTASAENAKSQALLDRQLQVTTGATDAQTKAVDAHLEALSEQSGVLITKLRPAYTTLLRTTHDSTKALQLQKLALDVSAGTGKDLQTVTLALSKSLTGNAGALNRIVPGAKGAGDQIAFLQKQFKGASKAAADSNPMGRFQVMMEKIKVTLGQALLPLMSALIKILQPLMPVFDVLAKVIGVVVKALAPLIQKIVTALMPAFMAIAKVLTPIIKSILPPLIKLLDKVLVPVLMFVSDLIVNYLVPYWTKLSDVLGNILTPVVDFITDAFHRFVDVLGPVWNFIKPVIDGVMALMGMKAEPVIAPKLDKSGLGNIPDLVNSSGLVPDGSGGAGASGDSKQVKLLKDTQNAILKARTEYEKAVKKANDQYASDVQAQINAFKDVFAKATEINIGDLFSAGNRTADSLINALKTKLAGIKNFAQDAAKLAGLGFSSDFIKQVMAQGPVIGDQLAQTLLTATPETAQQIKDLFTQTQDASQHGVDLLASSMQDQFATAAKALTDALTTATNTLNRTLETIQGNLQTSVITSVSGTIVASANSKTPSGGSQKIGTTIVVNNNVQTNATAEHISKVTVSSLKFGLPYSLPSSWTSPIPASPTH